MNDEDHNDRAAGIISEKELLMITVDFRFLGVALVYRAHLEAAPRPGDEVQFRMKLDGDEIGVGVVALVVQVRACATRDPIPGHFHVEICPRHECMFKGTTIPLMRYVMKQLEIIENADEETMKRRRVRD